MAHFISLRNLELISSVPRISYLRCNFTEAEITYLSTITASIVCSSLGWQGSRIQISRSKGAAAAMKNIETVNPVYGEAEVMTNHSMTNPLSQLFLYFNRRD